jgi:hypothetical protein
MFGVGPRTDTLFPFPQLGDATALYIPMERGVILGRDDRVELSDFLCVRRRVLEVEPGDF